MVKLVMTAVAMLAILGVSPSQSSYDPNKSTPEIREIEAKHYDYYANLTSLLFLAELPQIQQKGTLTVAESYKPHHNMGVATADQSAWLNGLAVNSDAVLVGRPLSEVSQLTVQKTFIFSDYEFAVDEVLKDTRRSITDRSTIVVSRPGGALEYRGIKITAIEQEFRPFILDQRYLLFLHRIQETGTYQVTGVDAYLLKDGLATPLQPSHWKMKVPIAEIGLLNQVRQYTRRQDGGNQ